MDGRRTSSTDELVFAEVKVKHHSFAGLETTKSRNSTLLAQHLQQGVTLHENHSVVALTIFRHSAI